MTKEFNMIIVRHGETDANRQRIVQGAADVPLNENGRLQAQKVGQKLNEEKFDAAYASDLSRAFDTAKAIVEHNQHFKDVDQIKKCTDLRERSFGVMERQPCSVYEAEAQSMNLSRMWLHVPEGGESEPQVFERSRKFIETVLADIRQNFADRSEPPLILVATHGGLLKELNKHLVQDRNCKMPEEGPSYKGIAPNTGVSRFHVKLNENGDRIAEMRCSQLYNADHLAGMDVLKMNQGV